MEFQVNKIEGEACFDRPSFEAELAKYEWSKVTIEPWSKSKERSLQQTRWWKGVLLPAMAKEKNLRKGEWEDTLKLNVMYQVFKPEKRRAILLDRTVHVYDHIPSISVLNCKQMNELIEGSVDWLRGEGYMWVTLPDSEMKG